MADTEKPSAPTNVKASNITANQVQLDWTASTDNIGVTSYQILRDGVIVGTAKGTTYSDSGLKPATSYSYQIKATDRAGNISLGSTLLSVKTIEGPEVPSNEWDATKTYVAGDKVTYKGKGYQAQWWTKGEEPGLATSIVWKAI
ncbi:fibronectin type III domain-containing protein [Carnobacterium divergens]|nr:fibronectin type III domain-containing protein [Carnobacterium divergens]MDV8933891.1 fibronectin type III domain-containing protein [Carnobacterium sp.]MDT1940525.1 fibronectin type III domain-containing protein [Carnobacterium divergens]MDT1942963.1 fibronectin type III domain-containing protein [Carnobacterium divergens]MDT1948770.1 fibronectin type III domain-containing protein [Carnobacterium divergens]